MMAVLKTSAKFLKIKAPQNTTARRSPQRRAPLCKCRGGAGFQVKLSGNYKPRLPHSGGILVP